MNEPSLESIKDYHHKMDSSQKADIRTWMIIGLGLSISLTIVVVTLIG